MTTTATIQDAAGLLREAIDLLDNQNTKLDIRDFLKGARRYLAMVDADTMEALRQKAEADQCRQTVCRFCGWEIENLRVKGRFPANQWRDRGNSRRCDDDAHFHKPVPA